MTSPVHLGIDLSTTTARCVALDSAFEVVGAGRCPHTTIAEQLRQGARRWTHTVETAVGDALVAGGIDARDVVSIGVATQGVSAVAVDDAGEEHGVARGWLDADGDAPADLADETLARWYHRSGRRLTPSSLAGRLLAGSETAAPRWSLAGDLLTHALTGEWRVDPCLASTTGLLEPSARRWSAELLAAVGIDATALSEVVPAASPVGYARGAMAARLGLRPEVVVAAATQDQRAAVLVADPDETATTITFGTAAAIVRRAPSGDSRLAARVPVTPGLHDGTWWFEGVVLAAGVTFDWFAETMGCASTAAWLDLAGELEPGAAGVECDPWFGGRGSAGWDLAAAGGLRGLQLGTGRAELARSVVDGVCGEIARNVALFERTDDICIIGRATANGVVAGAIAAAVGRPLTRVVVDEPTALGAALVGAQASGHVDSAHDLSRLLRRVETVEPGPQR